MRFFPLGWRSPWPASTSTKIIEKLSRWQTNKQTNPQTKTFCWKHPSRCAMLRQWKTIHFGQFGFLSQ